MVFISNVLQFSNIIENIILMKSKIKSKNAFRLAYPRMIPMLIIENIFVVG